MKCRLCKGSGDNKSGIKMSVNNHICPRCGGYGTIPDGCENPESLTDSDNIVIECNGRAND